MVFEGVEVKTGVRLYTDKSYGDKQPLFRKIYAIITILIISGWYHVLGILTIASYYYALPRGIFN